MDKQRLLITVSGRAIYLSHLDRMRTFQRAFSRAGMSLYHTEGFNPHPYISFAMPLPLGMESKCEILDFMLVDDTKLEDVPSLLNAQLPDGIVVESSFASTRKIKELSHLSLHGVWEYDNPDSLHNAADGLQTFFAKESILVRKLNKKKQETTADIAALISEIHFTQTEENIQINALVAAQNPGLNPNLLLEAIIQNEASLKPDFASFARQEIFDANGTAFR